MTHYTVTFTGTPREKLAQSIAETRIRIRNIATAFCLFNGVGGYWPERAIRRFLISGQWR